MPRPELRDPYLTKLQTKPQHIRHLSAQAAAQALYDFIQKHFSPGDECSLWSPDEAEALGYSRHWRVSWEAGPFEWGVLLTLGECMWLSELDLNHDHRPEVLLEKGPAWFTEPWYRFDIGFIER
jgi:hypothetical protein